MTSSCAVPVVTVKYNYGSDPLLSMSLLQFMAHPLPQLAAVDASPSSPLCLSPPSPSSDLAYAAFVSCSICLPPHFASSPPEYSGPMWRKERGEGEREGKEGGREDREKRMKEEWKEEGGKREGGGREDAKMEGGREGRRKEEGRREEDGGRVEGEGREEKGRVEGEGREEKGRMEGGAREE